MVLGILCLLGGGVAAYMVVGDLMNEAEVDTAKTVAKIGLGLGAACTAMALYLRSMKRG